MITMSSMHQGRELPPLATFQPAPEVPAHIYQELASYGEKHGLNLHISWDGWRGYWAVLQKGRVWCGPGNDDYEMRDFHAVDLVVEHPPNSGFYKPLELQEGDNRMLPVLDSCFLGDSRTEMEKFRAKRAAEQEKARFENDIKRAQEIAEESVQTMTTGSVEHALGKDKVHSISGVKPGANPTS